MINAEASEHWSEFQRVHDELLNLLRLAAHQVRQGNESFQYDPEMLEELFFDLNLSLNGFAGCFEQQQSLVNSVWVLEEALEEVYSTQRQLKGLASAVHTRVWEFLEDLENQLDFSIDLFDNFFVMTRIPVAFLDWQALREASEAAPLVRNDNASRLLQEEVSALSSFRPEAAIERRQEGIRGLEDRLGRKVVERQRALEEELKGVQRNAFWDQKLFEFCLVEACSSGKLVISQFLDSLYIFVEIGKLGPRRSAAFRLCFFHLMQFQLEVPFRKYDKRSRYEVLRAICRITSEELEELETSLPDLRRMLPGISKATGGAFQEEDFDPDNFINFLKMSAPQAIFLSNPGRIVLFHKLNLMNAHSIKDLRFKKRKKTALQVFTGTTFKRITASLLEIEGMSYWPNEKKVKLLMDSLSAIG